MFVLLRRSILISFLLLTAVLLTRATAQTSATGQASATRNANATTDSLHLQSASDAEATMISGYGEAHAMLDLREDTGTMNLARAVIFVGHRFSSTWSFSSEWEVENGVVASDRPSGEFGVEQAYLQYNFSPTTFLTAGLFVPRLGIENENHLPNTFNGVARTYVETLVLPTTMRQLGVGLWGSIPRLPELNYYIGIANGLSAERFEYGTGIREGTSEGQPSPMSALSISGAVQYYLGNLRLQASGYFAGSAGYNTRIADSLQLQSGPFGTPVSLVEADLMYTTDAFSARVLGTQVNIRDAYEINRAFSNNTPSTMQGAYAEVSYNLFHLLTEPTNERLVVFARAEYLDMNAALPSNGLHNDELVQHYYLAGLTYQPLPSIAIKADVTLKVTGVPNPALQLTPFPSTIPFNTNTSYADVGLAYSF